MTAPVQSAARQILVKLAELRRSALARRKALGISQARLAAALGTTRETVNRRERRKVIDLNVVDMLAWIYQLGGEITVTWRVTPEDGPAAAEMGRVVYPGLDLDGKVLPVIGRRHHPVWDIDLVVLDHDGFHHALPAANVVAVPTGAA